MVVTKSWEHRAATELAAPDEGTRTGTRRGAEAFWLAGASLLVFAGLLSVFFAKTQDFEQEQGRIDRGELVDLNEVKSQKQLTSVLSGAGFGGEGDRLAERICGSIEQMRQSGKDGQGVVPNVGALARLRVTLAEVEGDSGWSEARRKQFSTDGKITSVPLLSLRKIKPLLVVRTPSEYRRQFAISCGVFLLAFWIVHLAWRWRSFRGDQAILPALLLLSGIGLMLAVSIRDPLRDTLEFQKFATGVAMGCGTLLLPLLRVFDYRRLAGLVYTPLLIAFGLFLALMRFGSGPTGSDAKVNLGPFQPVEVVKVLLVFFMAGYLSQNWERLRDLHQKRFVPGMLRWLELPRVSHALPIMIALACALTLFFMLKDMGPALVMGFLFLLLFAVARGRSGLAIAGVMILVAGVAIGYRIGAPHTVVDRVSMWLSPWNNDVRGGDQLAHSLWAFSTGGLWGAGLGLGDPSLIPAGHTDLVLPSMAEEWGLPGVAAVFLLFALLVRKAFSIAANARNEYGMFLAAGLGALLALEMLLISGGALGAIPLSGVVSPFLSSGNTAMLVNFGIFAILTAISNQAARQQMTGALVGARPIDDPDLDVARPFRRPLQVASALLGVCALVLLGRSAQIEALQDQDLMMKSTLVFAQDGVKRPQRNPRLNLLAGSIPRGNIYDRNGVLLATSDWGEVERHRQEYEKLGISVDQACSRGDDRCYPFGPATEHLLGDLRTQENFHATNASLVERDSNQRLQGYQNVGELAGAVRYRHQRESPPMVALLSRDRNVRSTIDIRLQLKTEEILQRHLTPAGKKGALVMMDTRSGDVLALASWPSPVNGGTATPDELLDRARYGEYPPGSTFKLVTAMAALRADAHATEKAYLCRRLEDGRAGTVVPGWRRPIRDDIGDHPHGLLTMAGAIAVSCNAYFAQLGVHDVGSRRLQETADMLGIQSGPPDELKKMLPFAAYGQGPVVTTPFKLARAVATIAAGGAMPEGRWVTDESNTRTATPKTIVSPDAAAFLAKAMRAVVVSGTARAAMSGMTISMGGKTGTAQVNEGAPHSWFAGFAPYDGDTKSRVAFAVVVEHGGYGAQFAAPIGRELVEAAAQLGLIASPVREER